MTALILASIILAAQGPLVAGEPALRLTSQAKANTIVIPDQIAPAVLPYLACLNTADNGAIEKFINDGGQRIDSETMRRIGSISRATCLAERDRAALNADALLQKHSNDGLAKRRERIAKTLADIEQASSNLADMLATFDFDPLKSQENNHAQDK
ncbi:MAG: hypothetical protein WBO17_11605 [Sphingorhabdus sp.]